MEYTARKAIVFDVSTVKDRDIALGDIDLKLIEKDMFVAFYTGFIEREPYGTPTYFSQHPQLSDSLIDALLQRGISIIGIDFAGVRRGNEHTPKAQYCADQGVFIIENLCNLKALTGLPCRVIASL